VRRIAAGLFFAFLAAAASPLRGDDRDARRAFDAGRFDEARHLWLPLAAAGDAEAALNLGLLYDLGRGVPHDSSIAYRWYRQAAEAGLAQAAFNVAVLHDSGVGVIRRSSRSQSSTTSNSGRWTRPARARCPRATSIPPRLSSSCRALRSSTRGASMRSQGRGRTMLPAPGTLS
jgi:TPR repeat protein